MNTERKASCSCVRREQYLYSCEHPRSGHTEVQVGQHVWVRGLVQLRRLFLWQII